MSPLFLSECDCASMISDLDQLDGNVSIRSVEPPHRSNSRRDNSCRDKPINSRMVGNASVAHHLPVVTVCNMRSLFPKVQNFKLDFFERQVDVSLCCEVWERAENKLHKSKIEEMLEMDGLKYALKNKSGWGCHHCQF